MRHRTTILRAKLLLSGTALNSGIFFLSFNPARPACTFVSIPGKGQAFGWSDLTVDDIDLGGTSFGGYWPHIGPQGWYVDAVLMGTWFNGDASLNSNESIDTDGTGVTSSLEGVDPLALSDRWTLEPQRQIIWQRPSLNDSGDRFSSASFDSDDAAIGRLGFSLQGNYQTSGGLIQPYLKAILWHNFSCDQTIRFDGDPIVTEIGGTSLEFGGGVIPNLTEQAQSLRHRRLHDGSSRREDEDIRGQYRPQHQMVIH
jgi:autotransporter family porin